MRADSCLPESILWIFDYQGTFPSCGDIRIHIVSDTKAIGTQRLSGNVSGRARRQKTQLLSDYCGRKGKNTGIFGWVGWDEARVSVRVNPVPTVKETDKMKRRKGHPGGNDEERWIFRKTCHVGRNFQRKDPDSIWTGMSGKRMCLRLFFCGKLAWFVV